MVYLIVFTVFVFLFYIEEKVRAIAIVRIPILLMALSLPSIWAGCRDLTVGVDVLVYMQPQFLVAQSCTYSFFLEKYPYLEPLYGLLVYLSASYSNNIFWLFFFQQFIILFLVYFSYSQLKKHFPSYAVFIVYFLLFFHYSLCYVRQMLALSFCLVSFSFLLRRRVIKSLVAFLPAIGFHSTAFVYLAVYPIFYLANKQAVRTIRLFMIIGICIPILLIFYMEDILIFFVSQHVLPAKFSLHALDLVIGVKNFPHATFIYCFFMFIILQYSCRKNYNNEQYLLFKCLLFLCAILCPLGYFVHTIAARCILYFLFLSIIFLPMIVYKKKDINLFVLVVCFLLFYWYKDVVIGNVGGCFPYTSVILGIK